MTDSNKVQRPPIEFQQKESSPRRRLSNQRLVVRQLLESRTWTNCRQAEFKKSMSVDSIADEREIG
jgi:hypothetical protein